MGERSKLTTLCYIEKGDSYLMLHRVSKKHDVNKDKWIGIGGHFEENESPEECLLREAKEETGLTLTSWKFRGIVTFISEGWNTVRKAVWFTILPHSAYRFGAAEKLIPSPRFQQVIWTDKQVRSSGIILERTEHKKGLYL